MPTQTGSFDFKGLKAASTSATNYVAELNNGIFVHAEGTPSDPTNSNAKGVQITDDIDIIRKGKQVISIGDNIILGDSTSTGSQYNNVPYVILSSTKFSMKTRSGGDIFEVDGSNKMVSYKSQLAAYRGSSSTSATLSLSAGTITKVSLTTSLGFNNDNMFELNDGGIEVLQSGIYRITASLYVTSSSSTTYSDVFVYHADSNTPSWSDAEEIGSGAAHKSVSHAMMPITTMFYQCAYDGDVFYLGARCGGGGTLYTGNKATFLCVERIGL